MVADTHDICHVGDHHILLLADHGPVQSGRSCAERDDHHVKGMEISGYVWSDDMCHSGVAPCYKTCHQKEERGYRHGSCRSQIRQENDIKYSGYARCDSTYDMVWMRETWRQKILFYISADYNRGNDPVLRIIEGRKPKVRDIVILAVMCALAVTGRAAFFMLPNFSPTMAIVIISGVAFGCEGGFVVGAMSMLVSNFLMGQGPWTPWQMFAMGLVGFMAGLFFSKSGVRTKNTTKLGLCIFGALICILIYGGIMNPASVIIWQPAVNRSMIIASYVTGFPFDVVHGTATVIFLWLLARPFLEKLDRVRIKYGVL